MRLNPVIAPPNFSIQPRPAAPPGRSGSHGPAAQQKAIRHAEFDRLITIRLHGPHPAHAAATPTAVATVWAAARTMLTVVNR